MWIASLSALLGGVTLAVAMFTPRARVGVAVFFTASVVAGSICWGEFASHVDTVGAGVCPPGGDCDAGYEPYFYLFVFGTVLLPVVWLLITAGMMAGSLRAMCDKFPNIGGNGV